MGFGAFLVGFGGGFWSISSVMIVIEVEFGALRKPNNTGGEIKVDDQWRSPRYSSPV